MLLLSPHLLAGLDLKAAVVEEAVWTSDLVPTPLVNRMTADEAEFVAEHVAEIGQAGIDINEAAAISASKWRYGRRPVALLPLVERVLYRAVVNYLKDDLPPLERSSEVYDEFLRAPLVDESTAFVVATDLANYHSSIPTDRIARELVHRTGRWEPVEWLRRFYLGISGYHNGIPHGSPPSTRIAEVYANELHRRLLLRGLKVWRYADDFRIATDSTTRCVSALDVLDEEARALGLFVNERKTFYVRRTRYEEIINAPLKRLQEISGEMREDLTEANQYGGRFRLPEEPENWRDTAKAILNYWTAERKAADQVDVGKEIEIVKLLRFALEILAAVKDPFGLTKCHQLLRYEPQLTPAVANYMASLVSHDATEVRTVIIRAINHLPLSKWQNLWLLHVVAEGTGLSWTRGGQLYPWLVSCANDSLEALRSEAVWALSRHSDLDIALWKSVKLRSTTFGAPYIAAALNGTVGGSSDALRPASALDRKVSEWVDRNWLITPF